MICQIACPDPVMAPIALNGADVTPEAIASMIVLQLMLTYWTPLSTTFQTAPIGLVQWLEIIAFALFSSLIIALEKYWTWRERST